jgi:pimeloyl-ACP methyl ester carboxylesterase/DNA-binding CsgD family transcriptional regulator
LSKETSTSPLPADFRDALISYALDPTAWENFARALERNGEMIDILDPSNLLATLSQAETLAWQLRGQAGGYVGCDYYLFNKQGEVVQASVNTQSLAPYCTTSGSSIIFRDPATAANFRKATSIIATDKTRQVLLELHSRGPTRYGYLVAAEDLPNALKVPNSPVVYGLLIAPGETSEHACRVLQSSFNLTPSESEICEQLSNGLQLKEIARALNVSPNTVRNHLQAVFDKTGINRQGDLILMMTQLQVILSVITSPTESAIHRATEHNYPEYEFVILDRDDTPRRLAYRRYGQGLKPVIYFHETAGCSRLPPGTAGLANDLDLSIFAFERPGTGFSDTSNHYTFDTISADAENLADALGLESFSLLGYLAGAAYALATAARLKNRVRHLMLVSGRGSGGFNNSENSAIASLRRHLSKQPWLLKTFFNILRSRASEETNRTLLRRFYCATPSDSTFFADNPLLLEHMVEASLESMIVTTSGIVGDIKCLSTPTAVDLGAISARVSVWHGDNDSLSPYPELAEELQSITFDARIFQNHGSAIFYQYWKEILKHLAQSGSPIDQ